MIIKSKWVYGIRLVALLWATVLTISVLKIPARRVDPTPTAVLRSG